MRNRGSQVDRHKTDAEVVPRGNSFRVEVHSLFQMIDLLVPLVFHAGFFRFFHLCTRLAGNNVLQFLESNGG